MTPLHSTFRMGLLAGAFLFATACADPPAKLYSQALSPDSSASGIKIVVLAGDAVKQAMAWWDSKDVYQDEKAMCVQSWDYSAGWAQGKQVEVYIVTGFFPAKVDSATPVRIWGLKCPGPSIHSHPASDCQQVKPGTGQGRNREWLCTPTRWRENSCQPSDSTNTYSKSGGDRQALSESKQPFGLIQCGPHHIGYYFPSNPPNDRAGPVIPDQKIPFLPANPE